MRLGLGIGIAALIAAAPMVALAATPELIPVAEKGAVVIVSGPPKGLDAPMTVKKGEAVWSQKVRPATAARLLDPLPIRIRPNAKPLPAGQMLFAYTLSSGVAYCPPLPFEKGNRTVQCLRDLDGDGTFDACYVGDTHGMRSRFLVGLVTDVAGCAKRRYEAMTWPTEDMVDASVQFVGFRKGVAVFRLTVEDETLDSVTYCVPEDEGTCAIMGLRLRVEAIDGGARISLLSVEADREFAIFATGGPDLPNLSPKRVQRP